jgi:homoserine dehydrogenase
MKQKLALIGFGTVGQGLCEILIEKKTELEMKYDYRWELVAVSDLHHGAVYCPDGLKVETLLALAREGQSLEAYPRRSGSSSCFTGWDALRTIREAGADVICELTYTNLDTGEPATTHCREALAAGRHVVTSNKGPAALAYRELTALARKHGVRFLIEGTVLSGTPVLNLVRGPLAGCRVTAVKGILNGTTNYILSRMEAGRDYATALREAQDKGYAEADPTGDVAGYDARAKVAILAQVVLGEAIALKDIPCEGITQITPEDIRQAGLNRQRWKLIGAVTRTAEGLQAYVRPETVPLTHPLAQVMGNTNAVTLTTDLLGEVTISGPGAGRRETGFAILTDLLAIHRETDGALSR